MLDRKMDNPKTGLSIFLDLGIDCPWLDFFAGGWLVYFKKKDPLMNGFETARQAAGRKNEWDARKAGLVGEVIGKNFDCRDDAAYC